MAQPLHFLKKCLRDDDHKDEPTLNRTPTMCGGSREVGLIRRLNARSQYHGGPIGSYGTGIKKNLFDLLNPTITCRQEDRSRQKGIAILSGHAAGYKKIAKALRVLPSGKASK